MRDQMSPAPTEVIVDLIHRGAMAQVAYVAAELCIADHLASAPMRVCELAQATGAHTQSLHRLVRALVTLGLCIERNDGSFALSQAGSLLRADAGDSLRSWLLWFGRYQWAVWGDLLHTVRTGEGARKRATGSDGFGLFDRDPDAAPVFNMAMVQLTRIIANEVVRAYDFGRVRKIVDVGGGHGALLEVILKGIQTCTVCCLTDPMPSKAHGSSCGRQASRTAVILCPAIFSRQYHRARTSTSSRTLSTIGTTSGLRSFSATAVMQ